MRIKTHHPMLPFDLRDSAPAGVKVGFRPPKLMRDLRPEYVHAIWITLVFSPHIDIKSIANWLVAKLTARDGTEAYYKRTKINLSIGPMNAAIEREIGRKRAHGPRNKR